MNIEMGIERFLLAQDGQHPDRRLQADTYPDALAELQAGRKKTHWMWYVFPQREGLGSSQRAVHYGITSMNEVVDYLNHPVLRLRYLESSRLVLAHASQHASIYDGLRHLLGSTDAGKFRSSITLFGEAARICDSLQLAQLAATWADLTARELRACPETLDFIVESPPWCR